MVSSNRARMIGVALGHPSYHAGSGRLVGVGVDQDEGPSLGIILKQIGQDGCLSLELDQSNIIQLQGLIAAYFR